MVCSLKNMRFGALEQMKILKAHCMYIDRAYSSFFRYVVYSGTVAGSRAFVHRNPLLPGQRVGIVDEFADMARGIEKGAIVGSYNMIGPPTASTTHCRRIYI